MYIQSNPKNTGHAAPERASSTSRHLFTIGVALDHWRCEVRLHCNDHDLSSITDHMNKGHFANVVSLFFYAVKLEVEQGRPPRKIHFGDCSADVRPFYVCMQANGFSQSITWL
jgi:hypothetical protein